MIKKLAEKEHDKKHPASTLVSFYRIADMIFDRSNSRNGLLYQLIMEGRTKPWK